MASSTTGLATAPSPPGSSSSDGLGSDARIARALLAAADEGSHIVNLSAGTQRIDDLPPLAMQTALELLAQRHPDVLVAAAGNDGSERPCWPAAFSDWAYSHSLLPELLNLQDVGRQVSPTRSRS